MLLRAICTIGFLTIFTNQIAGYVTAQVGAECQFLFSRPTFDAVPFGDENLGDLEIADLDGDSDLDVVVVRPTRNQIAVLLNDGDGRQVLDAVYSVEEWPRAIAIGDLDGDGDADVALTHISSDEKVSILFNDGSGAFQADSLTYDLVDNANTSSSIGIGDLDGDGDLDLAVSYGVITVLLNDGGGTFSDVQEYEVGRGPIAISIGDIDQDGDLDLAAANVFDADISVLPNNGDGTFASQTRYPVGAGPHDVALVDLDGDMDLDFVAANTGVSDSISIYQNDGAGTFLPLAWYAVGDNPQHITVGDWNGDGNNDVAVSNRSGHSISVFENLGNGLMTEAVSLESGRLPISIKSGDLDGNGELDLIFSHGPSTTDSSISTIFNMDGVFRSHDFYSTPYVISHAVADFDNDGDLDIVTAGADENTSANMSLLHNNGDGTFAAPVLFGSGGRSPNSVKACDIDDDGDIDLVVGGMHTSCSYHLVYLLNDGTGNFLQPVAIDLVSCRRPFAIDVGDVDNDGDQDIVVFGDDLIVVKNLGNLTFRVTFEAPHYAKHGQLADLDSDGDLDLACVSQTLLYVQWNDGFGSFSLGPDFPVGARSEALVVNDLNHDNRPDIVVANNHSYNVSVYLNQSNGHFSSPVFYPVGARPYRIATGDIDGDGNQDLAVGNVRSNNVSILLNHGDGTFASKTDYGSFGLGGNRKSVSLADIDGDSDLDLIHAEDSSRFGVSISHNRLVGSPVCVAPSSIVVTQGVVVSATLEAIQGSDNIDVSIRRNPNDIRSRTAFEVVGFSPIAAPNSIEVVLESAVFSRSAVNQIIELWNFQSNQWELLDIRNASRFSDSQIVVSPSGSPTRFVEPHSRQMISRVRFESTNQRRSFTSNTDLFRWVVR